MEVIFCEYEGRPIRINKVIFSSEMQMWQSRGKIDVYFNCITVLKRCNTELSLWVGLIHAVYTYEYLIHLHSTYELHL